MHRRDTKVEVIENRTGRILVAVVVCIYFGSRLKISVANYSARRSEFTICASYAITVVKRALVSPSASKVHRLLCLVALSAVRGVPR